MKIIIGAGCVGLSMAYQLLKKYNTASDILIMDRYNIPTKGTSLKNSGVLHAGLYYPPNSEKSKLCINGHYELKNLCLENNLPILKCGKLIIASDAKESSRLENLYKNAINCGRNVSIVDYAFAKKIQPEVKKGYSYLWSPETCVFSPSEILNFLYKLLLKSGVKFIKDKVLSIDVNKSNILTKDNGLIKFSTLFNCAGPGSLDLYKKANYKESELTILPILGQYGVIPLNKKLKTNLYPVPDPNLPFLGIHLTPMINGNILVGPNAVPVFKKDV
ncbi:FAD-dependent oxidoreductase, partial [Prochlorococcus sp. AH-736-K15]|nr:FAD-dependent oxidoreductase [Prochlorococcus sp. AH-736-K15]